MHEDLSIKHGYYFIVDKNDLEKTLNIIIGKGYINDEVKEISIKEENGFINYYVNGKKDSIRDASLTNSFSEIVDNFLNHIVEQYTKNALVKKVDDKLVPFFERV